MNGIAVFLAKEHSNTINGIAVFPAKEHSNTPCESELLETRFPQDSCVIAMERLDSFSDSL